jgi:DNA-binding beta-propeller fold protein YncE
VSADGEDIYVAATFEGALARFEHVGDTLAFRQALKCQFSLGVCTSVDGLDGPRSVTLSPDGENVYVSAFSTFPFTDNGTVGVFDRDGPSGALSPRQVVRYSFSGPQVAGATFTALSPDGSNAYVASSTEAAITVFNRSLQDGTLGQVQTLRDGFGGEGLFGAEGVAVSLDGRYVLVASTIDNALAVFSRSQTGGTLTFLEVYQDGVDGVDGLEGARFVALSPDGRNVYVTSSGDNAVAVFAFSD